MNAERLFSIIMSDFATEILKQEAELERTINLDIDVNLKVNKIKTCLETIVLKELGLEKFKTLIINNTKEITNENGKV